MKPIKTPTTPDELRDVVTIYENAQYVANASEDPEELRQANARISKCERAIEACPFYIDENGNVVPSTKKTP